MGFETSVKRVFVGRKNYLEDFDEFINTSKSSLDGQVLLVVGDQGMGKTALLQAMAKRVADQEHVVALGEIDRRQSDFSAQIYPIIAQIKIKQKLKLGEGSDWLKTGLIGFAIAAGVVFGGAPAALAGGAAGLGSLLVDIRNRHIATGLSPITLVEMLHDELAKLDRTMGGAMRIALFLDPEKESPPDIIPLLRQIAAKGIPPRVRLIIAQRGEDAVIQAYEKGDLKGICCEPMRLALLPDDEEISFIEAYDISERLSDDVREGLVSKFKGWPLLLGLAITQLLKREGNITIDDVKSLPSDIDGFWKRRYGNIKNENSLKLVQTACLLPHPYPVDRLGRFSGLQPSSMAAAMNDLSVWELFEEVSYEDTTSQRLWHGCPYPKHTTAKDFVNGEVKKFEELKNEILGRIVSHYKETLSEDLSGGDVDRDALVFFSPYLIEKGEIGDFLNEVHRLGPIKLRYGLLDSYIFDHLSALTIFKELGDKEGMASDYGNMGNVYQTRGDLDKALEMYGKSLAINEELGRKEGMANQYGNMGNVYRVRGDLDKAEEFWTMSLQLFDAIGANDKIELIQGCLADLRKQ